MFALTETENVGCAGLAGLVSCAPSDDAPRCMIVILSPHLDDAVLSLGQFMATTPTTVVTAFAGIPPAGLSAYDASCGFASSRDAMETRRAEDQSSCELLDANPIHLRFLDAQYGDPTTDAALTTKLERFLGRDRLVFAPLGIGHPDHVQLARCARAACSRGTLVLYEELPYRVLHPEQVVDALDKVRAEGFSVGELPYPLEQGSRDRKAAAISVYASQFPRGADDPCLLVPERGWRVAR